MHLQVNRAAKRPPEAAPSGGTAAPQDPVFKKPRLMPNTGAEGAHPHASQRSTSGEIASPSDPFKKAMIGAHRCITGARAYLLASIHVRARSRPLHSRRP